MPTVTGRIGDIGLSFMPGVGLKLKFVPSSPGAGLPGLLTTRPVYVTPDTSDGTFSVTLAETGFYWRKGKPVHIDVFAVWLNPNDPAGTGLDDFLIGLEVPADGGKLSDLLLTTTGNDLVSISATAPNDGKYSGFQLNTVTGDLYKRVDS